MQQSATVNKFLTENFKTMLNHFKGKLGYFYLSCYKRENDFFGIFYHLLK